MCASRTAALEIPCRDLGVVALLPMRSSRFHGFSRINSYLNLKPSGANFIELEAVEIAGAFAGLFSQKDEGKWI